MNPATLTTEEIWELLSRRLRGFLRSRLPDDATADDLLQDTFIRIHRNIDRLQSRERLESWVFRIARNIIHDYYRARARARSVLVEPLPEILSGTVDGGDNLNSRVGSWLLRSIDRLPETYQNAVRLYEVEGISQREIARRLGLSLSATKSRVQRGRDLLRAQLDQCCRLERDRRGNVIECHEQGAGACEGDCGS